MKRSLFTFLILEVLLCASVFQSAGQSREIRGCVFHDRNGNGVLDKGETAVRDAGVSDGENIVWTGRKGTYVLTTDAPTVFPVIPDGWMPASGTIQNDIALRLDADAPTALSHDFALVPTGREKNFRVAVVGDVQVDSREEAVLARHTVLSELAGRTDLDFMLHMGDLVNDKPSLYDDIVPAWKELPQPTWFVAGNHDLDTLDRSARAASVFREKVGNDVAAWFRGKTCFIVLDNVEMMEYRVPESQMRFISRLLDHCPEDVLVVLCQHVPMGAVRNHEAVLDLLEGRKVLILSAHAHHVFRQEWRENISEVSVGASCGSWWTGERDMWDTPVALQQCGSPRNYFIFDFDGNAYTFSFKGVGLDESIQADVAFEGNDLVVNVYGGGEATTVEYSTDGKSWLPMTKAERPAPYVLRMARMNKEAGYPTAFSRRIPLRTRKASPHVWEAEVPDGLLAEGTLYRFRVKDSRGLSPFSFSWLK